VKVVRRVALLLVLCCLWFCWLSGSPIPAAWAETSSPGERQLLTLELLQKRIKAPLEVEGVRTLDLRRLTIDLRPENAEFRDRFYTTIQSQYRSANTPIGIDLSNSEILGEFKAGELGLRTALYGQTQFPFTEIEQQRLDRDRRRLSQLSQLSRSLLLQSQLSPLQITVLRGPLTLTETRFTGVANFAYTFFLGNLDAQGVVFTQEANWSEARFSKPVTFNSARFQGDARFRNTIFFDRAKFTQTQFQGNVTFQGSESEFQSGSNFHQAMFLKNANFTSVKWRDNADLSQTIWQGQAIFDRAKFGKALFLTSDVFEKLLSFRQAQFNQSVNLRGASILDQADFSDAGFAPNAYLNIPDLQFDPRHARIVGDPNQIGRVLSVPTLQGNETLLRNLVQNFRLIQQIPDANHVEYTKERLRLKQVRQRITGTDVNTASSAKLQQIGFSSEQAAEIIRAREQSPFRNLNNILKLDGVGLGTYIKVRDRITVGKSLSPINLALDAFHWFSLTTLLVLTRYGTSFWLIFGVGMVAIAHFAVIFWLCDRVRKLVPKPILPNREEIIWMLGGFVGLTLAGFAAIFRTGEQPWLTTLTLELLIVPIPLFLLGLIYWRGRFHDLMDVSYFVEDGTFRQVRFLIGRMPNIPSYPFFQERYMPIVWDKRWSWLYYFDFSLNNLLKFGFNDIRMRDRHMPGLITTLIWYQWSLGMLYFALLLWTLSRTIPGLNLLIYFK
jgi:hypothetical protein